MKRLRIVAALVAAGVAAPLAGAATGTEILEGQCASCHALSKPADASLDHVLTRKAPDLYYASVKFKAEWLTNWLQNPTVIRPGGVMYRNVLKAGEPGTPDIIDAAAVPAHPALDAAGAAAVTEALMALEAPADLVTPGAFEAGGGNASMAKLLFNKLRGCSSCHAPTPDAGDASGPELYTAGDRLQPDYIVEYIRSPQKFDPHVWMPEFGLKDSDVQKLAGYLVTLKQGGAQ